MSSSKSDKFGGNASPGQKPVPSSKMSSKQPQRREMRADFLLNFQRPPSYQRPQQNTFAPVPRRIRQPGRTRGPASFAKGRFVQSSFRLYVEDEGAPDVVEAAFDADAMLDWGSVRRVDLICEQQPKCPICLELELTVPKITRCGHLFCFPCVMRYFLTLKEYNGKVYQRCPVCNEQVAPDELISARLEMAKPLREGSLATFVLAQRDIGSTLVRLAGQPSGTTVFENDGFEADPSYAIRLPYQGERGWQLSRFVLLRWEEAVAIFEDEFEDLQRFRAICLADGDTELLPSTTAATELLEKQRCEWSATTEAVYQYQRNRISSADVDNSMGPDDMLPPAANETPGDEDDQGSDSQAGTVAKGASSWESPAMPLIEETDVPASSAQSFSTNSPPPQRPGPTGKVSNPPTPTVRPTASPGGGPLRSISFYQATDGRTVFLQPFFTKLLLHEHGGRWDQLPAELKELRLERLHEEAISEETRKRHKFLSHLPLGTSIFFAEVDLRNYLSKETKEFFADDFAKRRQQRKKDQIRSKREERISKERAAEEEQRFYNSLDLRPSLMQVLPTKEDFAVPLPGRSAPDTEVQEDGEGEDEGPEAPTLADKIKEQMAAKKAQEKKAEAQRSYFPELGPGSGNAASSSSWGPGIGSSKAASARSKKDGPTPSAKGEAKASAKPLEDFKPPPTFGEALEAALKRGSDSSSSAAKASAPIDQDDEGGAGGKKKKGRAGKATTIRLFG